MHGSVPIIVGPDVERPGRVRNPLALAIHQGADAVEKKLLAEPPAWPCAPRSDSCARAFMSGRNKRHGTVRHLVCLQPLEDLLRVMQDDGRGMQVDGVPGLDAAALPRAIAVPRTKPQRSRDPSEFQVLRSEIELRRRRRSRSQQNQCLYLIPLWLPFI